MDRGESGSGPMEPPPSVDDLFPGDDATSAAHRACDWAATPLGPVESWPAELCAAVRTVLPSKIPMLLWWGPELVQIFNHAYTPVLGDKYPAAVGQRGAECWAEVWAELGPLTEQVLAGHGATYSENQLLMLDRHGYLEETYWTFSYSPACDGRGRVAGIFVATTDVTARVLGDRRLETLRELGSVSIAEADTADDAVRAAGRVLAGSPADLPLLMIYLRHGRTVPDEDATPSADPGGDELVLAASFGVDAGDGPVAGPAPEWLPEVVEVMRTGRPVRARGLA
ncbi:PAS domain-containing protein, partial [Micromonospora phytophila]|uniref:PAS domain-containing protein n=1 Tax=Micromonospora phytophila TaxID=709888 RepID=UPI00202DF9E6